MTGLAGLDPCVHCGFCLQACPTFVATGDEADGPRGRIVLMQDLTHGRLADDDGVAHRHLNRCLGCRACETACPSGVAYGHALEQIRADTLSDNPLSIAARLVLATMADPRLRRVLLAAARLVRPVARWFAGRTRWQFALGSLAATSMPLPRPPAGPAASPAPEPTDGSGAVVFTGCIMEGLFGHVHAATARTLRVNGYRLGTVPGQGCCGALHAHAGRRDEAIQLARANVEAFRAGHAWIAVNAAGCGAMLKDYGRLLRDDPLADAARAFSERVRDVSELLADAGPKTGGSLPLTAAYDAPCHLHHAQRVTTAPETVLRAIPDLQVVPHAEPDVCCGSAGLYSLVQRELSLTVLDRKTRHIADASPDVVATGNPGCAMHMGAGLLAAGHRVAVVHPVELLEESYRRAGFI